MLYVFKNYFGYVEEKRPTGIALPSALVRRLGHQPPRPSPSRSRDGNSGSEESEDSDSHSDSGSYSSRSSNPEEGRSRKKRPRMRMYADDEEEKDRKKKLQAKLKEVIQVESKLRNIRPVHTRLGADISPPTNSASTSGDLRQRLGPSVPKNLNGSGDLRATLTASTGNSDDERSALTSSNHTVDLRSKLKSRLGAK